MLNSTEWQQALVALNLSVTEAQQQRFWQYLQLLQRWNKAYNLTAVRDIKVMLPVHLWDSLSVAPYLCGETILDVGSGAGLPGIPLAILMPERTFTLLDTNGKKTRFIQQATLELNLKNVQVVQARVEDWSAPQQFAAVISRAFASIADFVQTCAPHLENGGILYAMKGRYPEDELSTLPVGWQVAVSHPLHVPMLAAERHLIEIIPTA